jgi:hypothetical protein
VASEFSTYPTLSTESTEKVPPPNPLLPRDHYYCGCPIPVVPFLITFPSPAGDHRGMKMRVWAVAILGVDAVERTQAGFYVGAASPL